MWYIYLKNYKEDKYINFKSIRKKKKQCNESSCGVNNHYKKNYSCDQIG